MRSFLLGIAITCWSANAYATSPCMQLSEAQFKEKVIRPAQLVVEGEVIDYNQPGDPKGAWTRIKTGKQLFGKMPEGELTIKHWQAYSPPFFMVQKGEPIVAILKREGDGYVFTDDEWKDCIPSLIPMKQDLVSSTGFMPFMNPGQQWIALEDIQQYIGTHYSNKR